MNITSHLTEDCTSLLIFEISDVEYCLSNTILSSIAKSDNIYQLRTTERSKYSLLRIGNKSIPLIDLKKVLNDKKQHIDENSRVLIIEYKEIQFGLLVERIKEIIALDSKFVTTSLQFIPELKVRYIEGTIEFEDRKLLFLNIEKIITDIGFI
ncbi:MAG: chemotaxis protein CheW [Bacteroidetes bacterium]|nr:chemotaxis protein CheW [Bacteroidota bacterium]